MAKHLLARQATGLDHLLSLFFGQSEHAALTPACTPDLPYDIQRCIQRVLALLHAITEHHAHCPLLLVVHVCDKLASMIAQPRLGPRVANIELEAVSSRDALADCRDATCKVGRTHPIQYGRPSLTSGP